MKILFCLKIMQQQNQFHVQSVLCYTRSLSVYFFLFIYRFDGDIFRKFSLEMGDINLKQYNDLKGKKNE